MLIPATAPRAVYYIGVYAYISCSFNLQAIEYSSCPSGCSGNGQCDQNSHTCTCNVNFGGSDCSQRNMSLIPDVTQSGEITFDEKIFYYFDISVANSVVDVRLTSGSYVDLLVKKGNFPSLTDFDYSNISSDPNINTINIPFISAGRWYAGLFGFLPTDYNITLSVTGKLSFHLFFFCLS